MSVEEREPKYLIENGYLEKVEDFEYEGEKIMASLLGYRINIKFVHHFMGRIFSNPDAIFNEEMLKPELQDMATFAHSLKNLEVTQKRVAKGYLLDGTYEALCPPLKALVKIMIDGKYEGMDRYHPEFRKMFTRDYVINSTWYKERLAIKQQRDIAYWQKQIEYIKQVMAKNNYKEAVERMNLHQRLSDASKQLKAVQKPEYLETLCGTLGADPLKAIN